MKATIKISSSNNIILFLESKDYLCFGKDQTATAKALYEVYKKWYDINFYEAYKQQNFEKKYKKEAKKRGIIPKTVHTLGGTDARGYQGVPVRFEPGKKIFSDEYYRNNIGNDIDE